MSIVSCPNCGSQYNIAGLVGVSQIQCQKPGCGIVMAISTPAAAPAGGGLGFELQAPSAPTPPPPPPPQPKPKAQAKKKAPEAPSLSGDFDLDLKEWVTCNNCGEEYYPERLPRPDSEGVVRCRKCKREMDPDGGPSKPSPPAKGKAKGRSGSSGSQRGGKKGGPRKLVISDALKNQVFAALKAGKAKEAFQIIVDFTDGRLEDAKKVFNYLQKDAKKRGISAAPAPKRAPAPAPKRAPAPAPKPVPAPPPAQPAPPPMPAPLPGMAPPGGGIPPLGAAPLGAPLAAPLGAPVPAPAPVPVPVPVPAPAPVPAPVPANPDQDPPEQGFLQRVAISGRVAQLELFNLHKKYAQARELARLVTSRDPQNVRAYVGFGEALMGLGQEQEAFQAFQKAAMLDQKNTLAVRSYSKALVRKGEIQEAIRLYCTIAGIGFGEIQDAVALAELCKKIGDMDTADRIMKDALARAPHSLEPQRELALQAINNNDLSGATSALENLFREEPAPFASSIAVAEKMQERCINHPDACCIAARVFARAGRVVEGLRLLLPHRSNVNHAGIQRELGMIYLREGSDSLAQKHLELSHQALPSDIRTAQSLGELCLKLGKTKQAVDILRSAVSSNPNQASLLLLLATSYKKQGDTAQATEVLSRARKLNADDEEISRQIEAMHRKTLEDRIRSLRQMLTEAPGEAGTHLDLAIALMEKGEASEAFKCLMPACRDPYLVPRVIEVSTKLHTLLKDKRPNVLLLRALYCRTKNLAKAIQVVEEYAEENSDDEEMRMALIELYLAGQRRSAAIASFLAFIENVSKEKLVPVIKLGEKILGVEAERSEVWLAVARGRMRCSDISGGFEAYKEYLNRDSEDWAVRREVAQAALENDDAPRAIAVLKPLNDLGQPTKDDFIMMATAGLGVGREDIAITFLQKALDKDPDDPELQLRLTQAERAKTERALKKLTEELGGTEGTEEQRKQLAAYFVETDRRDQAIRILQSLGGQGEPAVFYHRFAAEHFARSGKLKKAEENLRAIGKVLNYTEDSEGGKQMIYRIGSMYAQSGDWRGAKRSFLELFAQDMFYRDVADQLSRLTGTEADSNTEENSGSLILAEVVEKQNMAQLQTIFEVLGNVNVMLDSELLANARAESARKQDAASAPPPPSAQVTNAVANAASVPYLNSDELLSTTALPDLSQFNSNLGPLPELGPLPDLNPGSFGSHLSNSPPPNTGYPAHGMGTGAGMPIPNAPPPGLDGTLMMPAGSAGAGPNPDPQNVQAPLGGTLMLPAGAAGATPMPPGAPPPNPYGSGVQPGLGGHPSGPVASPFASGAPGLGGSPSGPVASPFASGVQPSLGGSPSGPVASPFTSSPPPPPPPGVGANKFGPPPGNSPFGPPPGASGSPNLPPPPPPPPGNSPFGPPPGASPFGPPPGASPFGNPNQSSAPNMAPPPPPGNSPFGPPPGASPFGPPPGAPPFGNPNQSGAPNMAPPPPPGNSPFGPPPGASPFGPPPGASGAPNLPPPPPSGNTPFRPPSESDYGSAPDGSGGGFGSSPAPG